VQPTSPQIKPSTPQPFTWRGISNWALEHKTALIQANIVAILAAVASIPLPMLLPLVSFVMSSGSHSQAWKSRQRVFGIWWLETRQL